MNCSLRDVVFLLCCLYSIVQPRKPEQCEVAKMRCAYRVGCGMALQSYTVHCAEVMGGRSTRCSSLCKKALAALTSTEEGQSLVECDCHGSEYCKQSKQRIEVCRPDVMSATAEGSVVSCSMAQWICNVDPQCSKALDYYHRFCRSMFHGRKCTPKCNNSLAILNRQEKAAKLRTCYCDGSEEFECHSVKENTDYLCYGIINKKLESSVSNCLIPDIILIVISIFWTCVTVRICR